MANAYDTAGREKVKACAVAATGRCAGDLIPQRRVQAKFGQILETIGLKDKTIV